MVGTLLWLLLCPMQWRSQNAEKDTHIKGTLLNQTVFLFNYVPFRMGTSLKGKHLLPGGILSFKSSSLWYGKITFTTLVDLPWMLLSLVRTCISAYWGIEIILPHGGYYSRCWHSILCGLMLLKVGALMYWNAQYTRTRWDITLKVETLFSTLYRSSVLSLEGTLGPPF